MLLNLPDTPKSGPFLGCIYTPCNTCSLDLLISASQTASQSLQPFLHSWWQRVPILYSMCYNVINTWWKNLIVWQPYFPIHLIVQQLRVITCVWFFVFLFISFISVHHRCNEHNQTASRTWQRWQWASSWVRAEHRQSTGLWNYRCEHSVVQRIFYCWFIMVTLCNWADHYIFILFLLLLLSFFSWLNLSGRRLDVYHTSAHGVALVRI